jgi:hypothetical protein
MASSDRLSVHHPMGYPPKIAARPMAPRLDSLEGKTLYLVDARFDDSDLFLRQMEGWFNQHMPSVKTRFVQLSTVYTKDDPATWQRIQADGDAAIIGVGH